MSAQNAIQKQSISGEHIGSPLRICTIKKEALNLRSELLEKSGDDLLSHNVAGKRVKRQACLRVLQRAAATSSMPAAVSHAWHRRSVCSVGCDKTASQGEEGIDTYICKNEP